jgi:hypothetical protein
MVEREELLSRLRTATQAEIGALAKALGFQLGEDRDANVVHLADAFRSAASEKVYRTTLVNVARDVAEQAKWKLEKIPDTAEPLWVEDYVYEALGFIHRPDRSSLSEFEKAKERERAEQALRGQLPAPMRQSDAALAELAGAAGAMAVGWVLGLYFFVPLVAVGAIAWLFGPSMKKVVPATLVLIHIRKRQEFEKVLSAAAGAT